MSEATIVGFAPSWDQTPWDNAGELWGMNALHKIAPDKPWDAWFQLHDIDVAHPHDKDEHLTWLVQSRLPVYMFPEHLAKYPIPNGIPFPRDAVMQVTNSNYFTNTVSWMIGFAILQQRTKLNIYGIDMAQETEYAHQRPSCEYFIGLARGLGMEVFIPETSDLLKTAFLYGIEDEKKDFFIKKVDSRMAELQGRLNGARQQFQQHQLAAAQIEGAIEDLQYLRRAWLYD